MLFFVDLHILLNDTKIIYIYIYILYIYCTYTYIYIYIYIYIHTYIHTYILCVFTSPAFAVCRPGVQPGRSPKMTGWSGYDVSVWSC